MRGHDVIRRLSEGARFDPDRTIATPVARILCRHVSATGWPGAAPIPGMARPAICAGMNAMGVSMLAFAAFLGGPLPAIEAAQLLIGIGLGLNTAPIARHSPSPT
jgi:hypothetical protein